MNKSSAANAASDLYITYLEISYGIPTLYHRPVDSIELDNITD